MSDIARSSGARWHLASGIWHLASGIWYLASGTWPLVPGLWPLISDSQSIPRPAQRVDQLHVEVVVDLSAKAPHEDFEDVREGIVVLIPHVRRDRGAIDDLVGVADEKLEQRELFRRELDV